MLHAADYFSRHEAMPCSSHLIMTAINGKLVGCNGKDAVAAMHDHGMDMALSLTRMVHSYVVHA